ncbi:MAG: zinc-ribbon domain-containing protein [Clostridia bacterium]|nr:zinc-ribbon domain-containing protein [Clostridia bacterium]
MFCKRCGKEIPNNSNVCQYCGSQVTPRTSSNTYTNFNNPTINNHYQAPPAPQKNNKKTPWKIIAPIVAVLLIIAIVFGVFACANNKKKAAEEKLRQILEESTTKPIVEFMCEDYDGDGRYEAFAVVGKSEEKAEYIEYSEADICHVNEEEAEVIKESVRGHSNGTIEVGNTIYVSLEVYDDGAETGKSFIYTSEDNKYVEPDVSGKFAEVHEEDGKILGKDENGNEIEVELTDRNEEENSDEPKTNYDKLYEEYIQNTLIPKYGKGVNVFEQTGNYGEHEIFQNANLSDGLYSTYIEDLNSDGIPEMITARLEKDTYAGMVYIDLYAIENEQVVYKEEITTSDRYNTAHKLISVYAIKRDNKTYICIGSNGGATSGSSVQGEGLEIITINSENHIEKQVFGYSYAHGNEVLRHNDDISFQIAIDGYPQQSERQKAEEYFIDALGKFGLEEIFENFGKGSWVSYKDFPENAEHIKIFKGGCDYLNKDGKPPVDYREETFVYYFALDYTGFLEE